MPMQHKVQAPMVMIHCQGPQKKHPPMMSPDPQSTSQGAHNACLSMPHDLNMKRVRPSLLGDLVVHAGGA
jgi:hypothetical protein